MACLNLYQILFLNLCSNLCQIVSESVSNPMSESVFESVHENSNSKLMHAQESHPNSKNEVTIFNSLLQIKIESHVDNEDLNLFIAIRKGTRESTK